MATVEKLTVAKFLICEVTSHMHCEPVWVEFELSHFYANETENSTQLTLHAN